MPRYLSDIDIPRGFRFPMKNHVFTRGFWKEKSSLYEGSSPQSRSNSPKDGRAKQDSIGRDGVYPSSPAYPISLFPILLRDSGLEEEDVHQRRSETGNRLDVSPATRRNSRRAKERNSLRNPSCVYVFTGAAEILRGNK